MLNALKLFFLTFFILVMIDFVWLGIFMKDFYIKHLGALELRWMGVIGVYILLAIGLIVFVRPEKAVWYGGLFGLVVYGVYDLTNYATLAHWPLIVVLVDIAWGMSLCTITTILVRLLIQKVL